MKKLWLICLLISGQILADQTDAAKVKKALLSGAIYQEDILKENAKLTIRVSKAEADLARAVAIAEKKNLFGLSTFEWALIGGGLGIFGGVFLTRGMK